MPEFDSFQFHCQVLDLMTEAVLVMDPEGSVLYGNRSAREAFEVTETGIRSRTFAELAGAEDSLATEEFRDALASAFSSGSFLLESKVKFPGQDLSWCEICLQAGDIQGRRVCIACLRNLGLGGRKESAVRESEEKFSKIFNGSSNGMAVTEFDSGKIVDVNATWSKLVGISRADAVGETALSLGLWPSPEQRQVFVDALRATGVILDFETDFLIAGKPSPFLVSAERLEMGDKSFTLWEFRSVASRKEAEFALRQSEEKYRALVETAHDLIWSVDSEGNWSFVNRRGAMEIYGLEPHEMIGRPSRDFEVHAGEPSENLVLERLFAGESIFGHETQHRAQDGRIVDLSFNAIPQFDEAGVLRGVTGTARNITDRKAAEKVLTDTAQRLSLAQSAGRMGVWEWIPATNELIWDDRLFALFGAVPQGSMTPLQVWEKQVHPEDRARAEENLFRAYERGEELHDSFRILTTSGEIRYLESHAALINDDQGNPTRVIGLNADVSERRRLEDQLRLSQKMEAVGQLAGGVAHDFNNLLSVIIGYTDIVLSDMPPNNPFRSDLEQVLKAANRASSLTRQLLAFSRRTVMEMRVLDLNAVVDESETMLRRMIGEDIALQTHLSPDTPRIKADPNQLAQVLMNLAVNARDAMPEGGTLKIVTGRWEVGAADALEIGGLAPGSYALLEVVDTGVGMTPEVMDRAFEPFFTTKPQGKGTGLGLSVAHGIVRQSGGLIEVSGAPGDGATFRILLPGVSGPEAERPVDTYARRGGTERILLVEDEGAVRAIAERSLVGYGYSVTTAASGPEAIEIFEKQHGAFDLLLADVVMPGMSGPQLAEEITRRVPDLKVLFMSGYTADKALHHGIPEEALNLLQKPFTALAIAEAVRRTLDSV